MAIPYCEGHCGGHSEPQSNAQLGLIAYLRFKQMAKVRFGLKTVIAKVDLDDGNVRDP